MNEKYLALTAYIPALADGDFGRRIPGKGDGSDADPFRPGYYEYSETVKRFMRDAYAFLDRYPELDDYASVLQSNGIHDAAAADASVLDGSCACALILYALRAEHFSSGALAEYLENGSVIRWLKRLQELDRADNRITIRKADITETGTDAVVNAANEGLWAGSGVCGAIFRAAGMRQLTAACNAIGHCETGSAVITPGFALCRYIIHAVGPRWGRDEERVKEQLRSCYRKALELAVENGCGSITFPLISAGVFGVPVPVAWESAIRACLDFKGDIQIVFAIPSDETLKTGQEILARHLKASASGNCAL